MATRLLFASLPKTNATTKQSQHRTPFSAVATSRFLHISRLQASRILETIYEEETNVGNEAMKEAAASFKMSNRSSCLAQMPKNLSMNSDKFQCAQRSVALFWSSSKHRVLRDLVNSHMFYAI
ncbi:hypothetical protein CTI12_AA087150 [Artemisia annua]|uniref:Uncharacterized protein n=1 Tax=Artemisia annua TaxID=35608 RepID=A0A2U1Q158_ARTAN|nr:hypothetical protein CTI12_AA087150 [Artemisia annua]